MTISSTITKAIYGGNGSTAAFAVPFMFAHGEDVEVVLSDVEGLESLLTVNTDYTLSGEGEPNGGTCTLSTPPEAGQTLVIRRNPAIVQEVDYVENDPFPAATHEAALDKLTMICQTLSERLDRSVSFRVSSATSGKNMPEPEGSRTIVWNGAGNELANGPTVDEISNAQTYALNAATSETSAATSALSAVDALTGAKAARDATENARDTAIANITAQETASTDAISAEGTAQITAVNSAGNVQINNIIAEGNTQDARIATEGNTQIDLVQTAGASACTDAEAARDAAVAAQLAAEAARDTATDIASGAHNGLTSRDAADCHPTGAITGLDAALNAKADQMSVDTALAGKLDATAQAADSAKLGGNTVSAAATGNAVALRNSEGDLAMRYCMSSFVNMSHGQATRNSDTIFYSSANDYVQKNTKEGMQKSLGLEPGVDVARMSDLPAAPSTFGYNSQTFTASGDFTVPAGVNWLQAFCLGRGGDGGMQNYTTNSAASGGGPGGCCLARIPVTPGEVIPITIGGTVSVGSYVTCGAGGPGSQDGRYVAPAGSVSVANGAEIICGERGGTGFEAFGGNSGRGGNSILGEGGAARVPNGDGNPGTGYGSGGSGAITGGSAVLYYGGSGSPGIIKLFW